jgi:hypothetical protein
VDRRRISGGAVLGHCSPVCDVGRGGCLGVGCGIGGRCGAGHVGMVVAILCELQEDGWREYFRIRRVFLFEVSV